ncbi:Uma2 family endonuclease [Nodosilinea sp. FACHB-131]|uniref:Uma2 family endonuclease n=1 Tax=Cyanophyceae TaxID=3028117 RepID=UPI00168A1D89|nr:Uma2 family endonuclease [Nodosilinea sp. FACHB-131]MBD1873527.1 Uma2 family endonuclease [Nodosilinea sp. FACHB-131]
MVVSSHSFAMTAEAYLTWEPSQELRYEYANGEVVAMTGGTLPHNDIALNLYTLLRPHLKQRGCRGNVADAKVKITANIYRYPDLVVSCDRRDVQAVDAIQYPSLVVEVLSPGTEALDRGKKFEEYRTLPSLQEYGLINSAAMTVEIYRRGEGRLWLYYPYQAGDCISFDSIGVTCPIEQIYEGVVLPFV